ncbi:MAG: methyltransferase domain-containing protein, partial [Phormidesmis sp.]
TVPYEVVIGNGCNIPFCDDSFDLAFSNSVIEHVGDEASTLKFAQECERVGRHVYIQTPNHWFPMEPHFVALFIHWLPRSLYRKVAFLSLNYALFSWRSASLKAIFYEEFDSIRLLRRSQLKRLFPSKQIGREQVLGLTKSFIVSDSATR